MSSPSVPGKMEAKPLFNVQKALVQPVQMCMLDIPLSVQDDDVSRRQASHQLAFRSADGVGVQGAEKCHDPTLVLSGGGELVAKLKTPRAGTASRCDYFLSEAVCFEAYHVLQLPNPGHQNERSSLGGKGNLSIWKKPCVVTQCKRECLLCVSWLCCPVKTWEAAISCNTRIYLHAPQWVPCPVLLSVWASVLPSCCNQVQGLVYDAKIGVGCSTEMEVS